MDPAEGTEHDFVVRNEFGVPYERKCDVTVCDITKYGGDSRDTQQELTNSFKEQCEVARILCHQRKEFQENTIKQVETMITEACRKTHQSIDYSENDLLIKLQKAAENYTTEAQNIETKLMAYSNEVRRLENNMSEVTSDQFVRWRQLKDVKKQTQKLVADMTIEMDKIRSRESAILYQSVPNNSTFFEVNRCTAITGLMINDNQMVHVIDQRVMDGKVLLLCFDITDSTKEYWRYHIETDSCNKSKPLVASNTHLWYNDKRLLLLAIGKTVFIVEPYHRCPINEYVEKVSTQDIDAVLDGSWITSIAAHNPNNDPYDKFVITSHGSQTVSEYNMSGVLLRAIDVEQVVNSTDITCLAYRHNTFAIACRDQTDVTLVTSELGMLKICGFFKSPSKDLLPIFVICMGEKWWALFVSNGEQKDWRVLQYDDNGELVMTCDEGRARGGMDLPISLDIWRLDGFVSFANSTLRNFAFT